MDCILLFILWKMCFYIYLFINILIKTEFPFPGPEQKALHLLSVLYSY